MALPTTFGVVPEVSVGWKTETTYGTAITVDKWEMWQSATLEEAHNVIPVHALGDRDVKALATGSIEGTFSGEFVVQDMEMLVALGGLTDVTSATGAFVKHTITVSDSPDSGTIEVGHSDGTDNISYQATGLVINSWTVTATLDDVIKATVDAMYQDCTKLTSAPQSESLKTTDPYEITQITAEVNDTAITNLNSASITLNNNLAKYHKLGQQECVAIELGPLDVSFSFNCNMDNTTYHNLIDVVTQDTTFELDFTEATSRTIQFDLAACQAVRVSEAVDVGGGVVTCNVDGLAKTISITEINSVDRTY